MKTFSLYTQTLCLAALSAILVALPCPIRAQSNTGLSITMTSPTNGELFTAPADVHIAASVGDPLNNVAYVAFTASRTGAMEAPVLLLGVVSNWISLDPPQKFYVFDWTNGPSGNWTLGAEAVLTNGSSAASQPVQIIITNTNTGSLAIDIASPTNGAKYPAPTDINITAGVQIGNDDPAFVSFYDNSHLLGVSSNGAVVDPPGSPGLTPGGRAYFFDWTNQPVGIHVLTASVTDTNGNVFDSAPVTITIGSNNISPIVRITSPPNFAMFRAPVNISLLAYAFDPDGTVASVEFFAGSNSLGFGQPLTNRVVEPLTPDNPEPTPSPVPPISVSNIFELTWSNPPPATYAITAVATEDGGAEATSPPVTISVIAPPPPPTNKPAIVTIVATDPIAIEGTNCWPWLGGPPTWSNWVSPVAVWRWFTNCGPKDATFTVFRRGSLSNDLAVAYAIGGTASNGVDYVTLPGTVTIPAGQSEAMISVVPIDDGPPDISSTVILALEPSTNTPATYVPGVPRKAEVIIIDTPAPRAIPPGSVLPDGSFHLSLTGPDGAWFHIDYSTDLVNWTPVCTNQVVNGSIDFVDPDAGGSTTRMYRAVPMPNPPSN